MNKFIKCAKEMNDVMGLSPEINLDADLESVKAEILKNSDEVLPSDKFSDETWFVLEELTNGKVKKNPNQNRTQNTNQNTNQNKTQNTNQNTNQNKKQNKTQIKKQNKTQNTEQNKNCFYCKTKYRRELSIFEAIKRSKKSLSKNDIIKMSDEIYSNEWGGLKNEKQAKHVFEIIIKVLVACGVVVEENGFFKVKNL